MKIEGLEDKLKAIAEPVLESLGLELVDLVFTTEHGRRILRVFIDKPGGVTVDDCGGFSREFSTILDVEDPIPQRYVLEVSSPGLDRPLLSEKDFVRFTGKKAKIKAREAIDGRKNFKAVIDGVEGGKVLVTDFDGKKFEIPLSSIDRARLEVEF
ncbi:MAG: ribosome maturation factor RimP [Deltaproteobacteria bacterium]|nr:ribosome maturation factor RimP [Deltaproteobacteria bacterium]